MRQTIPSPRRIDPAVWRGPAGCTGPRRMDWPFAIANLATIVPYHEVIANSFPAASRWEVPPHLCPGRRDKPCVLSRCMPSHSLLYRNVTTTAGTGNMALLRT
jgi:hypothetical protein